MPARINLSIILLAASLFSGCSKGHSDQEQPMKDAKKIKAALEVLHQVLGEKSGTIQLEILPDENGVDACAYSCADGQLKIKGTSVSALSRGCMTN